jgi:tetratricopeptide (TPR) repeat protein
MSRLSAILFCIAFVLCRPVHSTAQVKDAFIQGVADFVNAANGMKGDDDGPALTAAIDAMAAGLAQWDAAVAKVEAGLNAEIGKASPPVAARMRAALGAVYLERGRWDAALKQFDAAVALDPQVDDVQYLRGLLHLRANRPNEAESAFRSALQRDPANVTTAYLLLHAASQRAEAGETNAAMKTLSTAVESAPSANRPQFMVLNFLDEASVAAPVFVPAAYGDAASLLAKANYDAAITSLRNMASTSLAAARDERTRLAAADARIESGDPPAARAALEEVVRAFPNSGTAHWKLGRLQEGLGDDPAALKSFQSAVSLPSLGGAANAYARIGRIQHNQLDLDAAIAAYERRVELTPNDALAHLDLGDVYRAQDRLDDALAESLIAALLDPANIRALATAAQIHAAAGRDDAAVRLLRRAVTLDSTHLEARYALGRGLMRLGQMEEGRRELQVFEQLQQKAMQDERRRFQENQIKIEETLKSGTQREPGR